ncbi:MAG: protein kinase domain-containing protein [Gammaproteobacteria bacterium]
MMSQRLCPHDGSVLEDKLPPEERLVGQTLAGKYRIEGFLSQGGMGAVYRATHVMLGKPIALKLIRPEILTSPEVVRRFQREARAASLLSHPNIVTIHDLGQVEDGTLYLAMELCAGVSLKDLIVAEGPLCARRAARLCRAIAGALALAHKNRIVHRDLKPQNVMVARDAEGHETPKLLDFGIAKAVETDGATLTSTGMVLGTPRYLSPEQAKGLSVDGRSDLYSLGIIFYEMLVGRVPFDDPSVPSLLVKHMAEPPRPPSDLRPGVPPAIESIVLRLLEKDPARRFQSAEDLSAALATFDPAVPAGNTPTPAASTNPSPGLRAPNGAAGVTITGERRVGVIDRRALDSAVPVGNAPTFAAGTNPTPGLRAPNAAAGVTITDERPPHPAAGPTLGGIPQATLPMPRDSMTARRPAHYAVKPSANRRGIGWPSAAVILLAASVALPLLTRSKPEAPLGSARQATNAPGAARLPVPEGAVVRRQAPYHPYAVQRSAASEQRRGAPERTMGPAHRDEPTSREAPLYAPPLPTPLPRAEGLPPPPPWLPPPPDARHLPPPPPHARHLPAAPPPFDPHRPPSRPPG